MELVWTPLVYWRLFESTGSIWAYLAYRRCATFRTVQVKVSLN